MYLSYQMTREQKFVSVIYGIFEWKMYLSKMLDLLDDNLSHWNLRDVITDVSTRTIEVVISIEVIWGKVM